MIRDQGQNRPPARCHPIARQQRGFLLRAAARESLCGFSKGANPIAFSARVAQSLAQPDAGKAWIIIGRVAHRRKPGGGHHRFKPHRRQAQQGPQDQAFGRSAQRRHGGKPRRAAAAQGPKREGFRLITAMMAKQ